MRINPYYRTGPLAAALAVTLCAGCTQYMGYHVEEQVVEVTSRREELGKTRTLKIEATTEPRNWQPVFELVTFVERTDTIHEDKIVRPIRVRTYGTYDFHNDYVEVILWFFGLSEMGMAHSEKDWHYFCHWPPIDLVARLCGSHGLNGLKEHEIGRENYDEVAPMYPLRLAHWFAWILPGHTIIGEPKEVRSAGEAQRRTGTQTKTHRDAAPDVRVTIQTSNDPDKTVVLTSDSEGKIQWDVNKILVRIGKNTKWSFTATAKYGDLEAELKKEYRGKDIGVTWEEPALTD